MATLTITTGFDTQGRSGSPDHAVPDRKYPRATTASPERFIALWAPLSGVSGRTVLSATLSARVFNDWAAQTTTVQRFAGSWDAETLTYNSAPGVTGGSSSVVAGAVVDGDRLEVDVTAQVQAVADGGANNGWKVTTDGDVRFYGFDAGGSAWTLTVELSDVLPEPTGMSPAGVVSLAAWVCQVDLVDDVAAVQVQVDPAADEVAPGFDSGEVTSTLPELDLAATAYAGLADGVSTFWRLRLKTSDSAWSEWSDWVEVTRHVKIDATLTNPSSSLLATNLYDNPSFETGVGRWVASSGAVVETTTDQAWVGGQSLHCVRADGTSFVFAQDPSVGDLLTEGPGEYTVVVRGWMPASNTATGGIRWGGTGIDANANVTTEMRDDWVDLIHTFTWDGSGSIILYAFGNDASSEIYLDGIHIVPGTVPPAEYVDGDQPDTGGYLYQWDGTPHASPSTKTLDGLLLDPSPSIEADATGGTVEKWRILVTETGNRAAVRYDSGTIPVDPAAASVAWQIPLRNRDGERVFPTDGTYDLGVRLHDRHDRVASPGDPPFRAIWTTVTMDVDGAQVPPDTLTVTAPSDGAPGAALTWTRASDPDAFVVLRDGEVIARLDEQDVQTGTGTWQWTDREAPPNHEATYHVRAVTNRKQSPDSPAATYTNPVTGVWIISDYGNVILRGDDISSMAQTEKRQTIEMPFRPDDVDVVTAIGGYSGTYSGVLSNQDGTVADSLAILRKLRHHPHEEVTLTWGTVSIRARLRGLQFAPAPELIPTASVGWGNDHHTVSFGFQQARDFKAY